MAKLLSLLFLLVLGLAVMLGNYWYTFGLWPKSWGSFIGFGAASMVLILLHEVLKEDS